MHDENVEDIYVSLAQDAVDVIHDDWGIIKIDFQCGRAWGEYCGIYKKHIEDEKEISFSLEYPTYENFMKLHEITTKNNSNQWNRAVFTLYPDGNFDIDFNWDQKLADDVGEPS